MVFIGHTEDKLALHELVMTYGDAVSRNNAKDCENKDFIF